MKPVVLNWVHNDIMLNNYSTKCIVALFVEKKGILFMLTDSRKHHTVYRSISIPAFKKKLNSRRGFLYLQVLFVPKGFI